MEANKKRFSLVVEGISAMLDGSGTIVSGTVSGTIAKGDTLYIFLPNGKSIASQVLGMEAMVEDKMKLTEEATDTVVNLQLDTKVNLPKYAVISSIEPQEKFDTKVPVENPALAGLIYGLPKHAKDNAFHAALAYYVAHAHFITPIQVSDEPVDNGNGTATFKKNATISYHMLKTKIAKDPAKGPEDCFVLPLFTDWDALSKWKGLSPEGQQVRTMVLRFQDMAAIIKGKGSQFSGIAINPFNKVPCTLPMGYIDTIMGTKGYQAEFAGKKPEEKEAGQPATAGSGKAEQKRVLLGLPKESEEVSAIRSTLSYYGKSHPEIKAISLMVKIEEATKKTRYLIHLDTAQEGSKTHMDAIFQDIKPLCKSITEVEFAIKGQVAPIDQVAEQNKDKMMVYQEQ